MTTEAKPILDTEDRRRILTEALNLQIQRRRDNASRLRREAMEQGIEGRVINLQLATEQDRLRRKAEQLKEEINYGPA